MDRMNAEDEPNRQLTKMADSAMAHSTEQAKPLLLINPLFGSMDHAITQLFLKSITDTAIDYLIIGDAKPVAPLPKNVQHLQMTLHDLVAHLKTYFPFANITTNNYYKICDLKPFLGLIAQDKVANFSQYKYWGYVDNDVWIDSRVVSSGLAEAEADVYLLANHTWGPLQFFRNNGRIYKLLLFRRLAKLLSLY